MQKPHDTLIQYLPKAQNGATYFQVVGDHVNNRGFYAIQYRTFANKNIVVKCAIFTSRNQAEIHLSELKTEFWK